MADKIVIITGASSGIGEATAKLLASKGATVALAARRIEKLHEIAAEIQATVARLPSIRSTSPTRTKSKGSSRTSLASTAGWTSWSTMPG